MNSKKSDFEAREITLEAQTGDLAQAKQLRPYRHLCLCLVIIFMVLAGSCLRPKTSKGGAAYAGPLLRQEDSKAQSRVNLQRTDKLGSEKTKAKAGVQKETTHASCCSGKKLATADNKGDSKDTQKTGSAGADANAKANERKPVLEPGQFSGLTTFGYASAKAAPEVMEKLFCYCGCDLTDSHNSLLDCFTSLHGVDCHICQEEAIKALKLKKDGMSIKDIQYEIDQEFANKYPFEEATETYKKYKSSRLYTAAAGNSESGTNSKAGTTNASTDKGSSSSTGKEQAGPEAPVATGPTKPPKLKPGKQVGKCCAGGAHDKDKHKSSEKK